MLKIMPLVIALVACAPMQARQVGEDFHTRVNIWYEDVNNIPSTNYHSGDFIPANTKVTLMRITGSIIVIKDEYDTRYTIVHNKGYVHIPMEELFTRLFSKVPVMGAGTVHDSFAASEKENIKKGSIEEGMSKDAVIMAYGYPPTHKTASLDSNQWQYWNARLTRKIVYFRDNKVHKIQNYVTGQFLIK